MQVHLYGSRRQHIQLAQLINSFGTVLRFLLATLSILIYLRGILLALRAAAKVAIKFINLVNKLR